MFNRSAQLFYSVLHNPSPAGSSGSNSVTTGTEGGDLYAVLGTNYLLSSYDTCQLLVSKSSYNYFNYSKTKVVMILIVFHYIAYIVLMYR